MIWLGGPAAKTHCVIFYTCCDQASDNNQFKEERLYFDLWFEGTDSIMAGQTVSSFSRVTSMAAGSQSARTEVGDSHAWCAGSEDIKIQ